MASNLKSPLGQVRYLGSARDGTHHWWLQRLTAVALIPLVVWFVISVIAMVGADYLAFQAWVASPLTATLLILLVVATFYHASLGVQVVIEDYVHHGAAKFALLLLLKGLCFLLGLLGVVSVLLIAV